MVDAWVVVAVGALALLLCFYLFRRLGLAAKHRVNASENQKFVEKLLKADGAIDPATQRTFMNMFSTAADKGEGLIEYYMTRHKCGRNEAMQLAIEAREREDK